MSPRRRTLPPGSGAGWWPVLGLCGALAGCPGILGDERAAQSAPGTGTGSAAGVALAAHPSTGGTAPLPTLIGNTGAAFSGSVSGPATLIGNTGGALIGNTGGALIGNTGGALVGNSGSAQSGNSATAYRSLGLSQAGLASAFVYLTSQDERLYAVGGKPVTTNTDASGHYDFGRPVVPAGEHIIVNAMLAGNRRLVGFAVARAGQNQVDIDVATTYVLEFLRSEAHRASKTFASYDLGRLPHLVQLTAAMLQEGRLGLEVDHLVAGQSRPLVDAYVAAMAQHGPELRGAWKALLGSAPVAAVRFAGTGLFGFTGALAAPARQTPATSPLAVAVRGDKAYLALHFLHQIVGVGPDGATFPVTGAAVVDPTLEEAPAVPEDGAVAAEVRLPEPQALAMDSAGNLFLTLSSAFRRQANLVLMICAEPSPKFGLSSPQPGRIYRVAGRPEEKHDDSGFHAPNGLTVDSAGNLYVADQRNDRVVRVDRQTGALTQVAGISPTSSVYPTLVDAEHDAQKYGLFRPTALVWRKRGPDEEIFVVDSFFQRIRRLRAPGGNWETATSATIAGSGKAQLAGEASVVPGDFHGDGGPAMQARFHFARVDTAEWLNSEISWNGLALDDVRNRLYVTDRHNGRVRSIDLDSGIVATVAGGGTSTTDGQASSVDLDQPSGLALEAAGNLLVTDFRRNVAWRILIPD